MNKRRSALIASDFQSADVACTAGRFTEIGRYVIGKGRYVTMGYGFLESQSDAAGRIFADIKDTADAAVPGTLMISVYTPEGRHYEDLFDDRTENLTSSSTNRTLQIPFAEFATGYGEDWIYVLLFDPDTTATVDFGLTDIVMNVTIEPKF